MEREFDVVLHDTGPQDEVLVDTLSEFVVERKYASAIVSRARIVPQTITGRDEIEARELASRLQTSQASAVCLPHEVDRHLAGSYEVTVHEVGPSRLEVLKHVRHVTGWDLTRTKQSLEQLPTTILVDANARDAADATLALEAAGAIVTVSGIGVDGQAGSYPRTQAVVPREQEPAGPVSAVRLPNVSIPVNARLPGFHSGNQHETEAENLSDQALEAWKAGDETQAEALWQRAAALGSSRAMVNLGRNCMEAEDFDAATAWFSQANEVGNADGAFWLGRMAFDRGDSEEAERWRWRAADLGDAPTLLWLAGREPDPDPDEEFNLDLMRRAAQAGSFLARARLSDRALQRELHEECIEWGLSALEKEDQADEPPQVAFVHAIIALASECLDDLDQARSHYEIAMQIAPDRYGLDEAVLTLYGIQAHAPSQTRAAKQTLRWDPPDLTQDKQLPVTSMVAAELTCSYCGSEIPTPVNFCPACGQSTQGTP